MKTSCTAVLVGVLLSSGAIAADGKIAEVKTSGVFFKDTVEIHGFDDPTIQGVACYVTPRSDRSISMTRPTPRLLVARSVRSGAP